MTVEPIEFEVHLGTVTVNRWPDEVAFSPKFLAEASERYVRRSGDLVTLTVENGACTYRLIDQSVDPRDDPTELRQVRAVKVPDVG
jgi:hypothetical protein